MTDPAVSFEPHRRRLLGLAYRMLGSVSEAEDVVQDAYLRWHAADRDAVSDIRAFLTTTTTASWSSKGGPTIASATSWDCSTPSRATNG